MPTCNEIPLRMERDFVTLAAMKAEVAFDSIDELITRKSPVKETLGAIVSQMVSHCEGALARIWLIKKGDICENCKMREECPAQDACLHLIASEGRGLDCERRWFDIEESGFRRFPIGIRKIGRVAKSGEPIHLDSFDSKQKDWFFDEDWIKAEKIVGFAAHPLKFQNDTLGVIGIFSREKFTKQNFEWLRVYAEQASIAIANARAFEHIEQLRQRLEDENIYLKEEIKEVAQHKFLIGKSPIWSTLLEQIEMVGTSDATVLIMGESGTGKEVVARAFHEASHRSDQPLVKVNCAAITSELFESEFFGHVKGAFTGAFRDRAGRFQLADGGTILLDEIGELPLPLQGKLLRVLQEKQFERVGEDITRTVDVRVIAATNKDLNEEVDKGNFRQDLFYRLSVFPIKLPPLRERIEDVEPLTRHFLAQFAAKMGLVGFDLTGSDLRTLEGYSYPGNVRELLNIVERAVILAHNGKLSFSVPNDKNANNDLGIAFERESESILTYQELKIMERENIVRALKTTKYKVYGKDGAAELVGAKPTTLISRIKSMKIPMRPES